MSKARDISDFLKIFYTITTNIESEKTTTLHKVWPSFDAIDNHLSYSSEDSSFVKHMKSAGRLYMIHNSISSLIDIQHKVAVLFHPLMKDLILLDPEQKNEVHEHVRRLIDQYRILPVENDIENTQSDSIESAPSFYNRFVNLRSEANIDTMTSDELTSYIDFSVTLSRGENIDDFDVFTWWLAHKLDFPILYKIFLRNATIQSTSCSSERAFSLAGLIITDKRTQLNSNTVDDIVISRNMY